MSAITIQRARYAPGQRKGKKSESLFPPLTLKRIRVKTVPIPADAGKRLVVERFSFLFL
jgi:hypothetical protein